MAPSICWGFGSMGARRPLLKMQEELGEDVIKATKSGLHIELDE